MLRKQATTYGLQCDKYRHGVLWAYKNIPHESTQEKSSFLLFAIDCHHPTKAAFMLQTSMDPVVVTDYQEELVKVLTSVQLRPAKAVQKEQKKYKT